MAISVTCGGCGDSFKVSNEWAGPVGRCPACGSRIAVPMRRQGMSACAIVLVVLGSILLIGAAVLLVELARARAEERRIRCRIHLNMLAQGMATYFKELGDDLYYPYPWPEGRPGCGSGALPDFGGAEWLASLYWTRLTYESEAYTCPSSGDSNRDGVDLGSIGVPGGGRMRPRAVSYAGLGRL